MKHSLKLTASHARGRFYLRHYFSERLSMDYYYITYHIDIETLHQDRLLELLNSYRLDILTKYKQLTDIYYSIEDGILFQHCTTVENHKVSKSFDMLHLNDDRFGQSILADVTYDLLDNWDIFRDDSLCAIEILPDIVRNVCTALGTMEETYDQKLDEHQNGWLYGLYTNRNDAIVTCHQLFDDGYSSEVTITTPNKPLFRY